MSTPDSTSQRLEYLREACVYKVNAHSNKAARTGRRSTGCHGPDGGLDRFCSAGQEARAPPASVSWE
jgi:hypothetical protein